jgi:hypothetical protein
MGMRNGAALRFTTVSSSVAGWGEKGMILDLSYSV